MQQRFQLHELSEDPDRWEHLIRNEQRLAETDLAARILLESIYCEANRKESFERFRAAAEFRTIRRILRLLNVETESRICEIGAGPGHLTWALAQAGFTRLAVLEPNTHYVSGTGYLASRPDAENIRFFSDEQSWYDDSERYENIITHNCIHHFRSIGYVAACVRAKMLPDARWFAFREWYADTAIETRDRLNSHPYALKYGVYEFPYSGPHYVQAIEAAGFTLETILPAGYADNVLAEYVPEPKLTHTDQLLELCLAYRPALLAKFFRLEHIIDTCTPAGIRLFTRPQLMVFRRAELGREHTPGHKTYV
ncbi:MAG: methyltransferase domain-containing protein [Chloroflexi bacterium]|nr:methyltransferase domain-containing protein [Chloroflexota bacterium]